MIDVVVEVLLPDTIAPCNIRRYFAPGGDKTTLPHTDSPMRQWQGRNIIIAL